MICGFLLNDVTIPVSEVSDLVKFHWFNLLAAILVELKSNYSLSSIYAVKHGARIKTVSH